MLGSQKRKYSGAIDSPSDVLFDVRVMWYGVIVPTFFHFFP